MTKTDMIKVNILAEGAEDFVGFWEILKQVEELLDISDSTAARKETLRLVREWLGDDLIVPGFPIDNGPEFAAWTLPLDDALRWMEEAWDALDGEPFTGDICWFVTTPRGREWLRL